MSQQRAPAQALLKAARRRGATGPAAQVLDAILGWSGSYNDTGAGGTLDPGAAAWKQLEFAAMNRTLGGYPEDVKQAIDIVPSPDFDASLGEVYGLTHLSPAGLRAAAADAAGLLQTQFHSADPASWRLPRPMEKPTAMGAGVFPPFPSSTAAPGSRSCCWAASAGERTRPRGRSGGYRRLVLEHPAKLLAELRRVLVAVHRRRMLGRGAHHLVLLAGDGQRAARLTGHVAAIGDLASHGLSFRSPRGVLTAAGASVKAADAIERLTFGGCGYTLP